MGNFLFIFKNHIFCSPSDNAYLDGTINKEEYKKFPKEYKLTINEFNRSVSICKELESFQYVDIC
jgi:hypothetical protein